MVFEILLVVLMLFCLTGVYENYIKHEKFISVVHPLYEPIKEVALYQSSKCRPYQSSHCFESPYKQYPTENQIFCSPSTLYNSSCPFWG